MGLSTFSQIGLITSGAASQPKEFNSGAKRAVLYVGFGFFTSFTFSTLYVKGVGVLPLRTVP
eukprot:2217281-Amphidinium_carterae.1